MMSDDPHHMLVVVASFPVACRYGMECYRPWCPRQHSSLADPASRRAEAWAHAVDGCKPCPTVDSAQASRAGTTPGPDAALADLADEALAKMQQVLASAMEKVDQRLEKLAQGFEHGRLRFDMLNATVTRVDGALTDLAGVKIMTRPWHSLTAFVLT